jgi:hypothetical protein
MKKLTLLLAIAMISTAAFAVNDKTKGKRVEPVKKHKLAHKQAIKSVDEDGALCSVTATTTLTGGTGTNTMTLTLSCTKKATTCKAAAAAANDCVHAGAAALISLLPSS